MEAHNLERLKSLLLARNEDFWPNLATHSLASRSFEDLFFLSQLRKKALAAGLKPSGKRERLSLAMLGGYSLYPLHELTEHLLSVSGIDCELWLGNYDNYNSEILEPESPLYSFNPDVVLLLPAESRCRYLGSPFDDVEAQKEAATKTSQELLKLCEKIRERTKTEIILGNFILPGRFDPGAIRSRTLASDWSFRKQVNLNLGLSAPSFVQICDIEFLVNRRGFLKSRDDRAWFESKQIGSPDLTFDIASEITHQVRGLKKSSKKVLALDLDNTLWGGVIGDDGLEGIEIGDTSPRGEAFKAFQRACLVLNQRGVLLAVCSKNDHAKAIEPFEKHPEMVLKKEHFASFKANWSPKSDNIRAIADELSLGTDSFVFVDDNPAEIEIVRQFVPEVETILLSPDPADYVGQLLDSRFFEPLAITKEDLERASQYRQEASRRELRESVTNMDTYLRSLEMTAIASPFTELDIPRITQLINKSNQFNLTTQRRTEAEVRDIAQNPSRFPAFTLRLADKFGDHGLIAVVICEVKEQALEPTLEPKLEIDTWLMSCRVLNRQVEELTVSEVTRIAKAHGCSLIRGSYLPTPKNGMVEGLYPKMGFTLVSTSEKGSFYELKTKDAKSFETRIRIKESK